MLQASSACLQHSTALQGRNNCRCIKHHNAPRFQCTTAAALSSAVGSNTGLSAERQKQAGWAQRTMEKQDKEIKRLDNMSDRLQRRLLDLDLDEAVADVSRIHSNSAASSSDLSSSKNKESTAGIRRNKRSRAARVRRSRPFPPSPEVLVALLRRTDSKRALLRELDVQSPRAGESMSACCLGNPRGLRTGKRGVRVSTRQCGAVQG
jgi:hypothetical protein